MEDDVKQAGTDRYAVSQAYRWRAERDKAMQELAKLKDRSRDTTMSAYDLLPEEDREALRWVREHGGLEEVRKLARHETKEEVELVALGKLRCLAGVREGDAASIADMGESIARRLMPEGYEWPRFESGEPVRIGDRFAEHGGCENVVDSVEVGDCWFKIHGFDGAAPRYSKRASVKRPAPKVYDADGEEIREKRDVWWICEGDERGLHAERLRVETIGPDGLIECSPYNGGTWVSLEPSELYVNKPVPASDGRPLREGETVWHKKTGRAATVKGFDRLLGEPCAVIDFAGIEQRVSGKLLTHERPESWEKWREDEKLRPIDYCVMIGYPPSEEESAELIKNRDLVRRARALAGVSE